MTNIVNQLEQGLAKRMKYRNGQKLNGGDLNATVPVNEAKP